MGASALGGSVLTGLYLRNHEDLVQAGGMSFSAGLIAYHAFKNPGWIKYGFKAIPLLSLLVLYSGFYNDKAAIGGISAGYLAFLFGL